MPLAGEWIGLLQALAGGTALGFVLGLVPGIGGRTGIVISIPFATTLEPYSAAVFLFALHSVVHTSSSIPAIALGMPLSGADAATVTDGLPLTRMGRGGEALGASLSASVIGGVLGALVFIAAIPIARPIVTSFGPPEILMIAIIGLTMIATLSQEGLLQGLVVGGIGVMLALVGVDSATGEARFTFGLAELERGLNLPALVCGLFVIPELLAQPATSAGPVESGAATRLRDVLRGMKAALAYKYLILRSSVYGVLVGMTPAVGSTVAVWMSYAYAARTVRSEIPFGQGAIAGVIAPEAANNSKEGGAMLPTLLLGIPGSSSMAVMMGALAIVGISAGQNMLGRNLDLSYILGATVAVSNIIAILPFFAVVPFIVRLTSIRRDYIPPLAISLSLMAALINSPTPVTIAEAALVACLGVALLRANWPRTPLVLGFVLAPMLEESFRLTSQLWGWSAFARPLFLLMLLGTSAWVVFSLRKRTPFRIAGPRRETILLAVVLVAAAAAMIVLTLRLPASLHPIPLVTCGLILLLSAVLAVTAWKDRANTLAGPPVKQFGTTLAYIAAIPLAGLPLSTFSYVIAALRWRGMGWRGAAVTAIVFVAAQILILSQVYDILVEREIIGRALWRAMGY